MSAATSTPSQPSVHADAIAWARKVWPAEETESVSHRNWASTYRLSHLGKMAYLKVVPLSQREQLHRYADLAERCAPAVPRLIASEPEQGWLLTEDHRGMALTGDTADRAAVAQALAALQVGAVSQSGWLQTLPRADLSEALPDLLAFLERPADAWGAAQFLGAEDAAHHAQLLRAHAPLLAAHIASAAGLPPTICHGDLHLGNAARHPDGHVVLFDWDELSLGPAGMCLHGLTGGCALATALLRRLADGRPSPSHANVEIVQAYLDTLVAGGYAARATLLEGLGGALCAGQMRFLTSFGRFPGDSDIGAAADTLSQRLSDLLDLCDWLSSRSGDTALDSVALYESVAEWERASRLVQDRLAHAPHDVPLLKRYARLCGHLGDAEAAEEAWEEVHKLADDDGEAPAQLAQLRLDRLDMQGCRAMLAIARERGADTPALRALDARAEHFSACLLQAASPDGWPRVAVTSAEREQGQLAPATHALVVQLFRQQGAVQLDGVFNPETMARLQSAFEQQHALGINGPLSDEVLHVGHRRYMLTMTLDEIFGASELVASGLYLPLMKELVGSECILSAYTAVVSLPGSSDQKPHKDHTALFEELGWQEGAPTFAAQVILPLLALTEATGATAVYKGSQGVSSETAVDTLGVQVPEVPLGSCLLVDYAVAHFGRGNRSSHVRPILNLVYSRPWFRDCRNYHRQPPLRFAPGYLDRASDTVKSLVSWWDVECRTVLKASRSTARAPHTS